jgi:ribonuclease HII
MSKQKQQPKSNPKRKLKPKTASSKLEQELLKSGFQRIVGIDEVGRGAWAGPVVVAGYVFVLSSKKHSGVYDSKMVTKLKRISLAAKLTCDSHHIALGSVELVNTVGIGKAIVKLIFQIIDQFDDTKTFFLIDGHFAVNFGEHSRQIIDGDKLHYSISAGSIIAKVYRDQLMRTLANEYAGYGFERNVGYPTKFHLNALQELGVSPIHRKSFLPILNMLEQVSMDFKHE